MVAVVTKTMSQEIKRRAKAAIIGAFVADAATMPLHWIYDTEKIQNLLMKSGIKEHETETRNKNAWLEIGSKREKTRDGNQVNGLHILACARL